MAGNENGGFLRSPAGKATSVGMVILCLGLAVYSIKANLGNPMASVNSPVFICAETQKTFVHTIQIGEHVPVYSSYSGKNTGYPAELCYWTKDGQIKKDPTYVLLNQYHGKSGVTFCPDCGRLVMAQNPPAHPGDKPPPNEAEYKARRGEE